MGDAEQRTASPKIIDAVQQQAGPLQSEGVSKDLENPGISDSDSQIKKPQDDPQTGDIADPLPKSGGDSVPPGVEAASDEKNESSAAAEGSAVDSSKGAIEPGPINPAEAAATASAAADPSQPVVEKGPLPEATVAPSPPDPAAAAADADTLMPTQDGEAAGPRPPPDATASPPPPPAAAAAAGT